MRPLVWFRSDLRVHDNTALLHACRDATRGVVGVFCVTPRQWKEEHDWGWPKASFVLRNLAELSKSLEDLSIALRIIETPDFSTVPEQLLELARREHCDALYYNREYEIDERERDERAIELFENDHRRVRPFTDLVLAAPGEVTTKQDGWYSVFTPFKKALYARWEEQGVPEPGGRPDAQPEMHGVPDDVPETLEIYGSPEHFRPDVWTAGEHAALTRLGKFCAERIDDYKDQRDHPAIDATSQMSPYLAAGVVSPRQCLARAMEANGGRFAGGAKGPDHWISEIVWREFYKHFVVGYPRVVRGRPFRTEYEAIEWDQDDDAFQAWTEGRTGVPIVDAAMRQINDIGWMHNRLRMIVAMYLTKDLFLDWRLGERYFARRLVDYDFASNNGGWQWSASTGADAAPYFRIFNPVSQSKRYDPDGDFIREYVPELRDLDAADIHDPSEMPELLRSQIEYPRPIADHKEARERVLETFKAVKPD